MRVHHQRSRGVPVAWAGILALCAVLPSAGCGSGAAGWGGSCSADSDCPSDGACGKGVCLEAAADEDDDGLPNGAEALLDTDPFNWDTDGDRVGDGDEVGADPGSPADTDGDGLFDVFESRTADADGDCLPDQDDPRDTVPDATGNEIARARCPLKGVCGAHPETLQATCVDGKHDCDNRAVPGWNARDDRCDGLDNDCDGRTDDGFELGGMPIGLPCASPGACGAGRVECAEDGLRTRCSSGPGGSEDASTAEACNGRDDDCDGVTDEDPDPADSPCPTLGACAQGMVAACVAGSWACDTSAVAWYEDPETSCDDVDNDCDGATDEDLALPPAGQFCLLKGVCAAHPEKVVLACAAGRLACDFSAVPGFRAAETACDGRDEDCDGQADDGEAFRYEDPVQGMRWLGQSCGSGACTGGIVTCRGDGKAGTCSTLSRAATEACNDRDDDCNGRVDDGVERAFDLVPVTAGEGEPRPRAAPALAAVPGPDGQGGAFYLYGGAGALDPAGRPADGLSDFWRYDPHAHRFARLPGGDPGPRAGGVLVLDAPGRRLVLAGGAPTDPEPIWTWDLDGQAWSPVAGEVPQRWTLAATLDAAGRLVLLRSDPGATTMTQVRVDLQTGVYGEEPVLVPSLRDAAAAVAPDGTAYVVGGVARDGVPNPVLYAVSPAGEATTLPVASGVPVRVRHAVAVLDNGSLLVVGGAGADLAPSPDVLRLVPGVDGTWTVQAGGSLPPPAGLLWPSVTPACGTAFLVGGLDAGGRGLRQVLRYDGAAAWGTDLLTLLPSPRRDGAMVVLPAGRSAWLVGGRETDLAGDRPVTDLWRISLDDLSFHPVALPGPAPLFVGGAAAGDPVTGDVYLYGGWSDVDDLRSVSAGFVRFRTSTLVAEDLPGGPEARALAGLAWTGDGLLLYGGLGAQGALGDVWRWTAADGWTRIDAPSRPALRPEVAWDAASRRLIAAGGTQPDQEIAAFDPEARTWTSLVALPGYADFGGEVAFLDPDGGSLAFLSAGAGGALADLDADPPTVTFREAPPPPAGSFHAFDPIGRRGLIFGGLRQDLPQPEVTSAFWTLPQRCPE